MVLDTLLPSITLTDPSNNNQTPSPALSPLSPIKRNNSGSSISTKESVRASWTDILREDKLHNGNIPRPATAVEQNSSRKGTTSPNAMIREPASMAMAESPSAKTSPIKVSRSKDNAPRSQPSSVGIDSNQNNHTANMILHGDSHHAIDPLSSQIMKRTSIAPALNTRDRQPSPDSTSRTSDARSVRSQSPQPLPRRTNVSDQARDDMKKGVKAVAFLSRLMGQAKKKEEEVEEQVVDNESVISETPPVEGSDAHVFSHSPETTTGFSIRSAHPPGYIKVKSKYKEKREFDRMFLAQVMHCGKPRPLARSDSGMLRRRNTGLSNPNDTVWAMEFSKDGKHLAAGADNVVKVWKVLASSDDRKTHELQESSESENAPVFLNEPVREYEGHEAAILDLSWSKNNFLLSSSMDKTVRLWHLSRSECLCTFKHNDFVPSIAFHPKDDQYFLTGSLDSKLRLWNIAKKNVAFSVTVPDMITAVTFMSDGKFAVAGTSNGSCLWYETEGLRYKTQLQIRPDRGTGLQGPKITGIESAFGRGGEKLLITSNDSRIRLYNVRDKGCEMVFKGNVNDASQIRASLSDDGRYVLCGSEDRKAFIWSVTPSESGKLEKRPVEYFEPHDSSTTIVRMAPTKTRRVLSLSDDPIYDTCTSPTTYPPRLARTDSMASTKRPTDVSSIHDSSVYDTRGDLSRSSSLIARSAHKDGNIIVTADYAGNIKVFRQDCAWHRRQQRDDWDRSSLFKRGDRNSLASSLHTKSSQRSLREAKNAAMAQLASSDRIMSWQQDITGTSHGSSHHESPRIEPQSGTSSPPHAAGRVSASESHETATSGGSPSTVPTSIESAERPAANDHNGRAEEEKHSEDPLLLDGHRSYMFWDKNVWNERSAKARQMFAQSMSTPPEEPENGLRAPALTHAISYVSQLSDEGIPAGGEAEKKPEEALGQSHTDVQQA